MIKGLITSKDIIIHPASIITAFGLIAYMRLVMMSLSPQQHFFLEILKK